MRTLISLLALTFCLTAVPVGAEDYPQPQGEKTGWLSVNQAEDLVVIWRKQKRVMTGIECRPDLIGETDLTERTQFRFTSVASGKTNWTWREFPAGDLVLIDKKLKATGFHRVAEMQFDRLPSGQKRICALWHK